MAVEEPKLSQGEVDLLFWQYCVGIVHTATHCSNIAPAPDIEPGLLNALAETRHFHYEKQFKRAPSYQVVFELQPNGVFNMKKITKP